VNLVQSMASWILVLLFALSLAQRRFDGDVVIRCSFDFQNAQHLSLYQNLLESDREIVDFWSLRDIHLSPANYPYVTAKLQSHNVSFETMIPNVQELVDKERIPSTLEDFTSLPGVPNPDPFFDNYRDFATITAWVKNRSTLFPNLVRVEQLNTTYQGREIIVAKIARGGWGSKPVIFYEGGIHAREWIGQATVCYIIGKLTNTSDPDVVALLDKFEFHIVPIVNGDGYVYTWTTDRNWRKTRSNNTGSTCIGTDPNRNWDDHWCQLGASTSPCSDSYCGVRAFSERETYTMALHINNTRRTQPVRMFIDWHAYGQLWMAPWGWSGATPPDGTAQRNLGLIATTAIRNTNGLTYQYGTIYNIIYPASGSSADYGYDYGGVIYSYGVELRDTGTYGFVLPANQIRPQGEEIWYATVAMGRNLTA